MKPYPALCKDCKHSKPDPSADWNLRCHNPIVNSDDPWALSGVSIPGSSCRDERSKKWFGKCGLEGKLWGAK